MTIIKRILENGNYNPCFDKQNPYSSFQPTIVAKGGITYAVNSTGKPQTIKDAYTGGSWCDYECDELTLQHGEALCLLEEGSSTEFAVYGVVDASAI